MKIRYIDSQAPLVPIMVRMPKELKNKLQKKAKKIGISVNALINRLLGTFFRSD